MKKSTKAGLVLATLAGTAVMMVSGASVASAAPGDGGALRPLVSAGTITSTQAKAVHDQLKADCEAAKAASRTTALRTLVSEGTITQAQADAVSAAERGGMRDLVQAGTITKAQAEAIKAEFEEYGQSKTDGRSASLAKLVSNGTITQTQSTAIAAALPAPGSKPKRDDASQKPAGGMKGARGPAAPSAAPTA
jgi:competence protein ComGC